MSFMVIVVTEKKRFAQGELMAELTFGKYRQSKMID
jgi:hypothetical protein